MSVRIIMAGLGQIFISDKLIEENDLGDLIKNWTSEGLPDGDRRVLLQQDQNDVRLPFASFSRFFSEGMLPNDYEVCASLRQIGNFSC